MKRLSIQMRVTLWFTLLMVVLAAISLGFLFYSGERLAQENTKTQMSRMVENAWQEIEEEGGRIEVDSDLEYFRDGVYLSVYDAGGVPLYGAVPRNFDNTAAFADGQLRTVSGDSEDWYLYDACRSVGGQTVWIRSVAAAGRPDATILTLLRLALFVLPFYILFAAAGGYLLARRAFRPVRRITQTAREIVQGNDLTRRIALGDGRDEIYTLAAEFDRMFARLEAAFEREKQFTSDVSHELRTPTSVILSQAEYALNHAADLQEAREALQAVLDQAEQMAGMISQLLTLARSTDQRAKLHIEMVNFSELAELVVAQMQEQAAAREMQLISEIEPDIQLYADETMLMRLLINLVDNGIKYGRAGGWVRIELHSDGKQVCGKVSDNGDGVRPEHRELVWERFWQADPARSRAGAGLGLSMVRWIVQAHGGSVTLQSEYGKGAAFLFSLPLDAGEPDGNS